MWYTGTTQPKAQSSREVVIFEDDSVVEEEEKDLPPQTPAIAKESNNWLKGSFWALG